MRRNSRGVATWSLIQIASMPAFSAACAIGTNQSMSKPQTVSEVRMSASLAARYQLERPGLALGRRIAVLACGHEAAAANLPPLRRLDQVVVVTAQQLALLAIGRLPVPGEDVGRGMGLLMTFEADPDGGEVVTGMGVLDWHPRAHLLGGSWP